MADNKNLNEQIKDLQPKPFTSLSLKEKLDLAGISVVPVKTPEGQVIDPYGIDESLDLFDLLSTVGNKVVNKDSFLDFDLVQKAFATYTGAKQIPKELTHLTEPEVQVIVERVRKNLVFKEPDKVKLEKLVEDIVFAGLLLLSSITAYTSKEV